MTKVHTSKKAFLVDAFRIIYPYWRSADWRMAWILTTVIVALNLGLVYISVKINQWYNSFYNSLQQKNFEEFKTLILFFCGWATLYIIGAVYRLYLQQMLTIRWRHWLTDGMLKQWLEEKRFYTIELGNFGTDNPDQRIAEDLRILASATLSLALGLLSSTTTLVSFFLILWNLSGAFDFTAFGHAISIPGYMVWAAFIYAFFGSVLTHVIGKRLITLNFEQQKVEANFRYSLVRVRENTESIALLDGETREEVSLKQSFADIINNWRLIMRYQKRLTWFTAAYGQAAVIFPLVVAAPRYFSGAIELGALMQISSAFGRVQDALSWFIDSYGSLTEWKASVDRLRGFSQACQKADQLKSDSLERLPRSLSDEVSGSISLSLPDGTKLQDHLAVRFPKNKDTLVIGKSGRGKSTLFRAISGLWPFVSGSLWIPPKDNLLFIPQKSYLPIGTLREVCWYPDSVSADKSSNDFLVNILTEFGLPNLVKDLDEVADWSKRLSGGEQQRIALIRAILKQPLWLFMDEATASLDQATQDLSLMLLKKYLPNTTIVQIAHHIPAGGGYNVLEV